MTTEIAICPYTYDVHVLHSLPDDGLVEPPGERGGGPGPERDAAELVLDARAEADHVLAHDAHVVRLVCAKKEGGFI